MTPETHRGEELQIDAGDVLCGRYRADRLIGRSETAVVVAATDLLRGGGVAIKMLEPTAEEVELVAARLRREAHVLSQLTSPHVVRVFDVEKHENAVCLVMELLVGSNLTQLVRKRGALPIEEAVGLAVQACDALAEAHARGIVHRDIKPQNLFLAQQPDGSSMLKVLDFGVSKQGPGGMGLTATGAAVGSPLFTAVEQFRDARNVDARADIWSLGLVLYFLLCRRNAFDGDNVVALMLQIAASPPASLRARRPEVPADLEAIIFQCVEKDPARRFQNVGALARALAPFGPAWADGFLASIDARIAGRRSLPSLPPARSTPAPPLSTRHPAPLPPAAPPPASAPFVMPPAPAMPRSAMAPQGFAPPVGPVMAPQPFTPPPGPGMAPQPFTPPPVPAMAPQPFTPPPVPAMAPQPFTPPPGPAMAPQPFTPPPARGSAAPRSGLHLAATIGLVTLFLLEAAAAAEVCIDLVAQLRH